MTTPGGKENGGCYRGEGFFIESKGANEDIALIGWKCGMNVDEVLIGSEWMLFLVKGLGRCWEF